MEKVTAPVRVGDKMPDFSLPMHPQGEFELARELGNRHIVLYFYPMDDTPGCTREACSFRDSQAEFEKHGALILGVSKDSLKSHEKFAAKYRLPFPLLTDSGNNLRKRLGNPGGGQFISRITYVVDKQGTVRQIINADGKAKVPDHISEALRVVHELAGGEATAV